MFGYFKFSESHVILRTTPCDQVGYFRNDGVKDTRPGNVDISIDHGGRRKVA